MQEANVVRSHVVEQLAVEISLRPSDLSRTSEGFAHGAYVGGVAQPPRRYSEAGEQEAWIKERDAALSAGSIMAQNNVWYPYVEMADDPALKGLPAQLRMNAIASHGGTTKSNFEAFSLAASIVGKCHFCVKAHYETLKAEGYTVENLRDIGRIASVMNSVAKVLNS